MCSGTFPICLYVGNRQKYDTLIGYAKWVGDWTNVGIQSNVNKSLNRRQENHELVVHSKIDRGRTALEFITAICILLRHLEFRTATFIVVLQNSQICIRTLIVYNQCFDTTANYLHQKYIEQIIPNANRNWYTLYFSTLAFYWIFPQLTLKKYSTVITESLHSYNFVSVETVILYLFYFKRYEKVTIQMFGNYTDNA